MGTSESKLQRRAFNAINSPSTRDGKVRQELKRMKKMDVNIRDSSGATLLCRAVACSRRSIVMELLLRGANTNLAATTDNLYPIHYAVFNHDEELTSMLLKHGANPNVLCDINPNTTPLISAVKANDEKLVELLLFNHQGGGGGGETPIAIDVNFTDKQKMTALMWAASEGNDAMVKFLLINGADVNRRDATGRTALYIARTANHMAIVTMLNEHFCKVNKIPKLVTPLQHNHNNNSSSNNLIQQHHQQQQLLQQQQQINNNNNGSSIHHQIQSSNNVNSSNNNNNGATDSLASSWSSTDSVFNQNNILNNNNNNNSINNINQSTTIVSNSSTNNLTNTFNINVSTTITNNNNNNNFEPSQTIATHHHKRENSTLHSTISSSSEKYCKVCWERPSDTVLLWCGHISICYYCSQFLQSCPICTQPIERVQRVFVS